MKKIYITPATQIVGIRKSDVIATSAILESDATLQFYNDDTVEEGY